MLLVRLWKSWKIGNLNAHFCSTLMLWHFNKPKHQQTSTIDIKFNGKIMVEWGFVGNNNQKFYDISLCFSIPSFPVLQLFHRILLIIIFLVFFFGKIQWYKRWMRSMIFEWNIRNIIHIMFYHFFAIFCAFYSLMFFMQMLCVCSMEYIIL